MADIVAILGAAADRANLPRRLVVGCGWAESRLNPTARRPADPAQYVRYWYPPDPFDVSGGVGQKTVRWMQPYLDWCAATGHDPDVYPGDDVIGRMLDLLNDPEAAAALMCDDLAPKWARYGPDAFAALCAYNWPAGGGRPYSPEHADNYRQGLAEADRILAAIPVKEPAIVAANDAIRVADGPARLRSAPSTTATILRELATGTALIDLGDALVDADGHRWRRVTVGPVGYVADELLTGVRDDQPQPAGRYTFNPDFPTQIQRQDWTCSIRSTMMMLDSIGIAVTPAEAQDAMSPRYVNADVGLLDASGAGIVAVLREHWGVEAVNFPSLSFDEAMSLAGTGPLALGLRAWGLAPQTGHWSAVRGKEGDRLVLANPAGTGPRYGQQTLDRQEFDARGPASGVYIPLT